MENFELAYIIFNYFLISQFARFNKDPESLPIKPTKDEVPANQAKETTSSQKSNEPGRRKRAREKRIAQGREREQKTISPIIAAFSL